jgi:hypothetical protein
MTNLASHLTSKKIPRGIWDQTGIKDVLFVVLEYIDRIENKVKNITNWNILLTELIKSDITNWNILLTELIKSEKHDKLK